jgi:hypothetical protein
MIKIALPPDRVPFGVPNILLNIHPKSNNKVK